MYLLPYPAVINLARAMFQYRGLRAVRQLNIESELVRGGSGIQY